ncbi:MAG: hypothetical protein ACLTYW_04740 [Collinsella sp.]
MGLRDRVAGDQVAARFVQVRGGFHRFFDEQLRRLRTDHIDYYLHNITSPAQWERVVALGIEDWIACQRRRGAFARLVFRTTAARWIS